MILADLERSARWYGLGREAAEEAAQAAFVWGLRREWRLPPATPEDFTRIVRKVWRGGGWRQPQGKNRRTPEKVADAMKAVAVRETARCHVPSPLDQLVAVEAMRGDARRKCDRLGLTPSDAVAAAYGRSE
jgi:hypothetical protein